MTRRGERPQGGDTGAVWHRLPTNELGEQDQQMHLRQERRLDDQHRARLIRRAKNLARLRAQCLAQEVCDNRKRKKIDRGNICTHWESVVDGIALSISGRLMAGAA